ncbi:ESPR-type extended signal peptide-containing protein, partial [Burkholderia ubonensis]|uniref:ESPR-type extended signal peptide-containing protein n=1 Tax=Burkholderia ubonensis TaxID=101571 RepID=UPI0022B760F3
MNKSYRTVWNESIGAWVAVSENDKARGARCSLKSVTLVAVVASALIGGLPKKAEAQYTAGGGTAVTGSNGIAIGGNGGGNTTAATTNAIAIGAGGTVAGTSGLANAGGEVAIGQSATATGIWATAIGSNAKATGSQSSAFGNNSTASGAYSSVFGFGATATGINSVVVGVNSKDDSAAVQVSTLTVGGNTYNVQGKETGVFSIGSSGAERQIINVAPGQVTLSSTNAVNGSQLFATDSAIDALSTSTSTGLSSANSSITSLSTSASTGISTAQSGVSSLSTGLSTTNSNV